MTDAKILGRLNKWFIPMTKKIKKFNFKIGDLVDVGQRLCLIEKFSKHKKESQKRVLVRWVGEETSYWISCNIFLDLMYWEDKK